MKKFIVIIIIVIIAVAALFFWFFKQNTSTVAPPQSPSASTDPFGQSAVTPSPGPGRSDRLGSDDTSSSITSAPVIISTDKLPRLRQLSATPVGGFMASTTASSTLARYIDRGVGHIYDAHSNASDVLKISNTTIPRVYMSFWNKNGTAFDLQYMKDDNTTIVNFYGELRRIAGSASSTSEIPFEIKGKYISPAITDIAVAPKGDKIATINIENGQSVISISGFDESKRTQIATTPLTQISLEWPEDNTLAVTTSASAHASGYLYFVNVKIPSFSSVVGGLIGLTTKVSADAKRVIYSAIGPRGLTTYLKNLGDGSTQELVFRTLAEKCVWSKLQPMTAYCAVPSTLPQATLPDDWYKGNVSFDDQIWSIDTTTGEVHIIANPLKLSDALIDAVNLQLDPKENFLYFMNKRDLTLWSLDLTQSR